MHGGDVPAALLADPDSQFIDIGGIVVHYKQAFPPVGQDHVSQWPQEISSSRVQPPAGSRAGETLQETSSTVIAGDAEACRGGSLASSLDAIVLVHGFGGGVFSWRHVMQPLADAAGIRVVALDRPGFGKQLLRHGHGGCCC